MNGIKLNYSILLSIVILFNLLLNYQSATVEHFGYFIGLPNEKQHDRDSYFNIYAFTALLSPTNSLSNFKADFLKDINTKSKIVYGAMTTKTNNGPLLDKEFYFMENNHYYGDKMTAPYRRYLLPANRESQFQKYYIIWDMQYNTITNINNFKIKFFTCKTEADTFKTTYFSSDLAGRKVFMYDRAESGVIRDPFAESQFQSGAEEFDLGDNGKFTYRDIFIKTNSCCYYIDDNTNAEKYSGD